MPNILLVEDDPSIRAALGLALEDEGYVVLQAPNGRVGLSMVNSEQPDLVLLDLRLPDISGFEVCREIRQKSTVPIIMVTAQTDTHDLVAGLEAGADDYVTKPFSTTELLARVRAVLRRIRPGLADDRLVFGDIVVDRVSYRVKRGERDVHLGPTEFRLLDYFMQHPGRVFSREQLLDAVWGSDVYVEARTVDVHVGRLRKALNEGDEIDPIRTVRSAGYALDKAN